MNRRDDMRRRLTQAAPWIILGTILVIIAGIAGAAQVGSDHVQTSSAYCASCHEDQAGQASQPGHEDTACQECHPLPEGDRLRFVWAIVEPDVALPDHGEVDEGSCETCHGRDEYEWNVLMRTDGHASHAIEPDPVECVRCHAGSLHADPDPEEGCLSCHEDVPLETEPVAESECIACHVFGEGDGREASSAGTPGHGTRWANRVTVDQVHGAADCRLCHNPHEPTPPTEATPECTSCHRGEIAETAPLGPEQHGECNGCHQVHGDRERLPTLCVECHARPDLEAVPGMPRPGERAGSDRPATPGQTETDTPGTPAAAAAVPAPLSLSALEERTHEGKCPTCHRPHAFVASPDVCSTCHEHDEQVDSLKALPEGSHGQCVDCHEPHQPPPGHDACRDCHRKRMGRGVPGKHRDCLSCHAPHTDRPTFDQACSAECHDEPRRRLRAGPARHRNCGSCHNSHGDPDRGSAAACRRCHQEQASSLRRSQHDRCASCHAPHSFEKAAASARCSACHTEPTAAGAAHQGDCASCHDVHGGPAPAQECSNCHEEVQLAVGQHRCNGCHKPHQQAQAALTQCGSCHRKAVRTASNWPSESPHAGACMDCHETHAVQDKAACRSCHEQQATRAHVGNHDSCTGCHAPHRSPPARTAGWWEGCSDCHRQEGRRAASAGAAKHRECRNCHDRPERKAPTCLSCHDGIPNLLAHGIADHQNCSDCHSTHGTPRPTRRRCLACHDDMRDHNPNARWCQACHPFSE